MAFSGQSLSNLAYALNTVVQPRINELIFSGTKTMDQIKKVDISDMVGENLRAYFRQRLGRAWNTKAVTTSAGYYPAARNITGVKPYLTPGVLQTSIGFDKASLLASKSSRGGVESVLEEETDSKIKEIRTLQDLWLWAGHYGHLGRINDSDSGTSAVLTMDTSPHQYAKYVFYYKMYLDSYDGLTSGTIGADSVSVASVSGNEVTLGGVGTLGSTAENDYVFVEDSYGYAPTSIPTLVDSYSLRATSSAFRDDASIQTVMGLSRSTYPQLEANIVHYSNTARALTLDLVEEACGNATLMTGKECDMIWSTDAERTAYLALVRPDRRYTSPDLKVNGGWTAMAYSHGGQPIPWVVNRHCTRGQIWFLHMPALYMGVLQGFEFDEDRDGARLHYQTDSTGTMNAYVAYGDIWYQVGCDDFESQTVARDIDITSYVGNE